MQVRELDEPGPVFEEMVQIMCDMVRVGLVHCDFNEFNVIISPTNTLTAIDFPQMVSVSHANARELFERDLTCITRFFEKKMGYHVPPEVLPVWDELLQQVVQSNSVDVELHASGFKNIGGDSIGDSGGGDTRGHSHKESSAEDSADEPSFHSGSLGPESVIAYNSAVSDGRGFTGLQVQGSGDIDLAAAQRLAPSRMELASCTTGERAHSQTSDYSSTKSHDDVDVSGEEDSAHEQVWHPCDASLCRV